MKEKTTKNLVRCFVLLAYSGIFLILFELIYATHIFVANNLFSIISLYGFVLFYGYLFGGLVLMIWIIKNRNLLERKALEHQLQKKVYKTK